jgi:excisionase family DNA binding protein
MCLLTEDEAAGKASVSRDTIRRLIAAGRLEWVNLGSGTRRKIVRIPCEALARVQPPAEREQLPRRRRRRPAPANPIW